MQWRVFFRNTVGMAVVFCVFSTANAADTTSTITENLTAQAVVKAKQKAVISSQLNAKIEKLLVREGDHFKKGDLLVAFDCKVHEANLRKARAMLASHRTEHQANQRLAKLNAISKVEVAKSKAELSDATAEVSIQAHTVALCKIEAPFSGNVVKLDAQQYESVQQGQAMLEIIDNSELDIELLAPSKWLNWLKPGKEFKLYVAETGKEYPVNVTKILPEVDAVSQSVKVIGKVDGHYEDLIAGMSGTAKF